MPTLQSPASVHDLVVSDRTDLAPGIVLLSMYAPEIARVTRPGQFVMVIPPSGERAAVALAIYEGQDERISLLFFVSGPRTRQLAQLRTGDSLAVTGPLGNGFTVNGIGNAAIVAGGVGIASVLLLAKALIENGTRVQLYYGARTSSALVEAERFRHEGCEVFCATDDGSFGHHGFVTELLAASEKTEMVFACGPSPMLRATAIVAARFGVPAQLCLEETFGCGVGGCWGCVVPIDRASSQAPPFPGPDSGGSDTVRARICKEGPVFWAHDLRW